MKWLDKTLGGIVCVEEVSKICIHVIKSILCVQQVHYGRFTMILNIYFIFLLAIWWLLANEMLENLIHDQF